MKAYTNPSDSMAGVPLTTGESDASADEALSQSLFPLFLIVGYIFLSLCSLLGPIPIGRWTA